MSKNKKNIILRYSILFILLLFWSLFIVEISYDEIWNYGFSYSIMNGLIPYKDFNLVITPFVPFLYAIPLKLISSNILVLYISNTFIILFLYYLLEKMFGKQSYFFLTLLIFQRVTSPNYNLILLTLFVLLIYLERSQKEYDFLIGFILALCVLTKQSVGIFLLLPSFYYLFSDRKRFFKRVITFICPCLIFLIYLILTKSLFQFLDLCLFGLFDFGKENGHINIFFVLYWTLFIHIIYLIKKKKNSFIGYYILAFSTIAIPLFDIFHFFYFAFTYIMYLFLIYNINLRINNKLLFTGTYIGLSFLALSSYDKIIYPNNVPKFEYRLINSGFLSFTKKVNNYMEEHDNYKYVFLNNEAYFFRIINNQRIGYLDLINYGNQGYNGTEKLIKKIKILSKNKNYIFVIKREDFTNSSQTNKEAIRFVFNKAKKVDSLEAYDFYSFDN